MKVRSPPGNADRFQHALEILHTNGKHDDNTIVLSLFGFSSIRCCGIRSDPNVAA